MSNQTIRLTPRFALSSPLLAASGTLGDGMEVADLADLASLGALIAPTLTVAPHPGNPMPRVVETPAGLLHATGLPNPGLDAFLADRLPVLRRLPCPLIVSIAGETPEEWRALAAALGESEGVAALELNLTPFPLLRAERVADPLPSEAELLATLSASVAVVRAACELPLLAKLPSVGAEIGRAAQACVAAGADMISVGQAFPGVAARSGSRSFRFPGIVGGLSGPCIKPLALYQVWRAAQSVAAPILGAGGVMTVEDVLEFFVAGASAVAVGTANLISPSTLTRLASELEAIGSPSGVA